MRHHAISAKVLIISFSMTHAFTSGTYRKIIPSFQFKINVHLVLTSIIALLYNSNFGLSDNTKTQVRVAELQ